MSQIDKAFLSAYAKKRPIHPSTNEAQTLVDPTGERILKIHLTNSDHESLQPHVPVPGIRHASASASNEVGHGNSVHISQSSARIASLSSIRRETLKEASPEIVSAKAVTSNSPTKPIAEPVQPPARKTLTSYLNQARQSSAPPTHPTLGTPSGGSKPTMPSRSFADDEKPGVQSPSASPIQQYRFDAPHSENPSIQRPPSTIPWSFGIVERSIKATADSKSIAARTSNESQRTTRAPTEPRSPETSASAIGSGAVAKPATVPMTDPHSKKPDSAKPAVDSLRNTPPIGKSLDVERLAKISLPIQPVWEVDEFLWPKAVANLLTTQAEAFHEIGLHLQHAQSKGLRVLSITSGERGVGRSTVSMCLAKSMSRLGLKIALFDGDYECPSLVDQLNLEAQHGWQQCLLENIPLDEVAIHAVDEAITLFPLTDSIAASQVSAQSLRINKLIKRIANAYDMVIIDANRVTQKQCQLLGTGDESVLDATLLIVDAELSLRQRVDAAVDLVKQQGVQSIGLVENFHS